MSGVHLIGLTFGATLEHLYRVRFCHRHHRQEEINPIGMYDSSNESSQRTEKGSVKRFDVLSKFFILWQNSVFCAAEPEMLPNVTY